MFLCNGSGTRTCLTHLDALLVRAMNKLMNNSQFLDARNLCVFFILLKSYEIMKQFICNDSAAAMSATTS